MGGTLLQLVATGAADVYLIGKPVITMFKTVYKRHQDFSIYDIKKIPKAKSTLGIDFQVELERSGDLLHKVYLVITLPELNLKNPVPSCDNVKKILKDYGIIWDTTETKDYNITIDNCPSRVTLEIYNNTIIEVINDHIRQNVDQYNFYSNADIFSSNPSYLRSTSQEVIDRALKSAFDYAFNLNDDFLNFAIWGDIIKEISLSINKNELSNGIVGSLMMSSRIMTKYAQEYLPVYSSKYLPNLLDNNYQVAQNAFGAKKREIVLYSDDFRNGYDNMSNILFSTGSLLQMLMHYYYDTTIMNLNPKTSPYSHGHLKLSLKSYFNSNSLFGELLNRPPNTLENEIVKFRLYNSNDIKNISYISLMYNLTRLKIERNPGPYDFKLDHGSIYIGDISPPLNEPDLIGVYNPYVILIDENIIFYHVLDPRTTSYEITDSLVGKNISIYFNEIIQERYKEFEAYCEVFPFYNGVKFTLIDAHFIYQKYINDFFSEGDFENTVVRDTNQVEKIAEQALFYINYNIQYNLALIRNMTDVLNNSKWINDEHYRFSYHKGYTRISTSSYSQKLTINNNSNNTTFSNNSQETINIYLESLNLTTTDKVGINDDLTDNFENSIRQNMTVIGELKKEIIPTKTPGGADIKNYFSDVINERIQKFRDDSGTSIAFFENLGYMNDYLLWERGIFDIGKQIQKTYLSYHTDTDPQFEVQNSFSEQYKRHAVMNYIPFLIARDIPAFIYYIFSTSIRVENILELTGDLNTFLDAIDYRDDGDGGAPLLNQNKKEIKAHIYEVMIDSVMGVGTDLHDKDHYDELINQYSAGGNDFLLTNTLRPEALKASYDKITNLPECLSSIAINCNFEPQDIDNISYLPIEWLSQTYCDLFEQIIEDFWASRNTQIDIVTINNKLADSNAPSSTLITEEEEPSGTINIKEELLLILRSAINCFVAYTENGFPQYTSADTSISTYTSNGYTLLGLLPETSLADPKYFIRDSVNIFKSPQYSDATSSIWYQIEKKYIIQYNALFNDTLISKVYYENQLGILMSNIFDYFKNTINGERSFIYYYDKQDLRSEEATLIGFIQNEGNFNDNQVKSITVIINGTAFGNASNNFEERVLLSFKTNDAINQVSVLKNHLIGFNLKETIEYSETFDVPDNIESVSISYINNPGYQIYLNIIVYLNEDIKYFEFNINDYEDKFLKSWHTINDQDENELPENLIEEPHAPISKNTNGFDFYRLRNLDVINQYTGKSKYIELQDFTNDNITLFNYNLKYYEDYSLILDFVRDDDLIFNDGNTEKTRKLENYFYEQSFKILNFLFEHINTKYLDPLPLTSNYNEIQTNIDDALVNPINQSDFHQISDVKPEFSQEKLPLSNKDIIGFSFRLSGNLQNDFAVGFGVGSYPYSRERVQIKKIGSIYSILVSKTEEDSDILDCCTSIRLDCPETPYVPNSFTPINPSSSKIYYFFQNNKNKTLKIYEYDESDDSTKLLILDKNIPGPEIDPVDCTVTVNTTINSSYESIVEGASENFYFHVNGLVTVQFLDLFESYEFVEENSTMMIEIEATTKWFYAGINGKTNSISHLVDYLPIISNIQQILHTVYLENDVSVNLDPLNNITTTQNKGNHPFGETILSPPLLSKSEKIGFAFTVLNNTPDFDIGIYGSKEMDKNGKIVIRKIGSTTQFYLEYGDQSSTIDISLDFEENKIYYFFYYNDVSADPKVVLYEYNVDDDNDITKYTISNSQLANVGGEDIRNLFHYNFNFILSGSVYVRYYMDRFAYWPFVQSLARDSNANFIEIRDLIKASTKWYYIGGSYSVPYDPDLVNLRSIEFLAKVPLFDETQNNIINLINIGQFNFNDIVFPSGNNLLTYAINVPTQTESTDIIAYAFSVIDNTSDSIGIGLGTDGYFSEKRLIMSRDDTVHTVKIYDGITTDDDGNLTVKSYNYNQTPIFDKENIYYCFQDNTNGTFSVYEDKNVDPLIVLRFDNNLPDLNPDNQQYSPEYANLLEIFKNNSNLFVLGKTNIRFYTAKFAYSQTSEEVQKLIEKTTKWFHIGAEDITPFISTTEESSLGNVTYRFHTGYLENGIIKRLNNKLYYTSQLERLNKTINPLVFSNVYNLDGIHGSVTNVRGKETEIGYNTAIYGILDSIYNIRLTGNMDSTFKSINTGLPEGKIFSDLISNEDNPFYSYCLYDYFVNVSSKVNYDGHQIKTEKNKLENSDLLTYGNLLDISNMFDDVIHEGNETEHVLQDLKYIKEPSYIKSELVRVNTTDQSETSILTEDINEHRFSENAEKMEGFPITNSGYYGLGFTIDSIIEESIIEIGVIFDNDVNRKIVLRKNDLRYDLLIQNGDFKKSIQLDQTPNFNSNNNFTFFISNEGNSNADLDINKSSVTIYENSVQIINYTNPLLDKSFLSLFEANKVHLFINGNINIRYYSRVRASDISNTTVGKLIDQTTNSGNFWLYVNQIESLAQTQQLNYRSYTVYQKKNANRLFDDFGTITFVQDTENIIKDHIFIPTAEVRNNDVIGFAFEVLSADIDFPSEISIGLGSGDVPNTDRLQIKKKNGIYSINISGTDYPITKEVDFRDGNIYLCIQNNKEEKFTVYRYNNNNISLITEITARTNRDYEIILNSVLNINTNLLVTEKDNIDIKFYTAKFMFNKSFLNNKILIGNLTKWLYLGALDTKPIIKTVIDPNTLTHHQLVHGLTLGGEVYDFPGNSPDNEFNDLINPPIISIPLQHNPSTGAVLDYSIESSLIKLDNPNYNDIILNDTDPKVKPIGIGIVKIFDITNPVELEEYKEYVGITPGANTLKKIYGFAFSIIEKHSNFSIGFSSWINTYIVINRQVDDDGNEKYQIIIKYLEFIENVSNGYKEEIIEIQPLSNNPCTIFYVFQNNDDNTFSLYEENKLIVQIEMFDENNNINSIGYASLLTQVVPPLYGSLKTLCTLCIEGTSQTTLRVYAETYVKNISPISIRNILNLDDIDDLPKIVWFGVSSVENRDVNNTSDYRVLSANNNSTFMEPPVSINETSLLADGSEQIDKLGLLGFSFSLIDFTLQDFNSNGLRIGLSSEENIRSGIKSWSSNPVFSLIEMQIFDNRLIVEVNNQEKFYIQIPSFTPTDIYYVFQNNDTQEFTIYENDTLIFKINTNDEDYKGIVDKFNDPIYFLLSGKAHIKMHNAPYAYINSISEVKILIDSCDQWLYLGGTNLGPIERNKITSSKLFRDKNVVKLFNDPLEGPLSDFSLVALYTYFEILRNSPVNDFINLKPFIDLITITEETDGENDKGYTKTIEKLNNYVKEQVDIYFKRLTKITNVNLEERELIINGFNAFLDNSYKQYPLDFNFDVFFYQTSPLGRPNGIIYSDLESRLLKLIMNAPPRFSWVKELGHKIIKEVSVSIGDQVIETYTSDLTHLHHKFRIPPEHERGYNKLIGNDLEMYQYSSDERSIKKLYIPLYFWFCENEGNALPMISLLHSRVMLNFKIESLENLFYLEKDSFISGIPKVEYSLLSQYVYLDEDERMRMAKRKLEYLMERYIYNGETIISQNTYFSNELSRPVSNFVGREIDLSYDNPIVYALGNLVYHQHESITSDSTIEQGRTGKLNFREIISRSHLNHNFLPSINLSTEKVIGFCFQVISKPETSIKYNESNISNNITNNQNLTTFTYGVGFQVEIYKIENNKKLSKSIRQIELRKDEILITKKYNSSGKAEKVANINYISRPNFKGGGIDEESDLYLYIQNDIENKIYIYENSNLISMIDLTTIDGFTPVEGYKRNVALFVYGAVRVFYYNARKPYNVLSKSVRKVIDTVTDWFYVGGDNLPITEITSHQETLTHNIPPGFLNLQTNGKTVLKTYSKDKIIFNPFFDISRDSLVGFSFSINHDVVVTEYDIIIGLGSNGDNDLVVGFRKIKDKYDIFINDGTNTSSIPLLRKPINSIQDKTNPIQNQMFRPEIIYTCIQDNITGTFTIYQENEIIGQVDTTDPVYDNLFQQIQNNVNLYLHNIKSSSSLLISYYTSEEVLSNHARLVLRQIINNVTHWISLNEFRPSFYTPSFRNIKTSIIDNVSNKGKIKNQTNISSDVITEKEGEQYILRPTTFADITRMVGFSFNIIEPVASDFEIGFSVVNHAFKHVVLKKDGNDFYLEISNVLRLPSDFEEKNSPASLKNKLIINEIRSYNSQKKSSCQRSEAKIQQLNKQIAELGELFNMHREEYDKSQERLTELGKRLEMLEEQSAQDITNEDLRKEINKVKAEIEMINTSDVVKLKNQIDLLEQNRTNEKIKKKSLRTSLIEIDTFQIPLSQDLIFGVGSVYTIIQDNTLGIFSLFLNEKIIGQVTLSTKKYRNILPELINGMDVFICGKMNLRFYSPQYIYNTSSQRLRNYMDRIDHFYFVRQDIPPKEQLLLPYEPTPVPIRIRVTDPIKYFVWYMKVFDETTQQPIDILNWSKYGFNIRDECANLINISTMIKSMKIKMYGVDRERKREENYFTYVIPWARNVHAQSLSPGEYMYSFALYPMLLQPSGSANYSEIEDSVLVIEFTNEVETIMRENKNIKIKFELWGRSINHVRFISGMGALLFNKER